MGRQRASISRHPDFIIIGSVLGENELNCLAALNGKHIPADAAWNAIVEATYLALSAASSEPLLAWHVHDISAVLCPDIEQIGFAARLNLTPADG